MRRASGKLDPPKSNVRRRREPSIQRWRSAVRRASVGRHRSSDKKGRGPSPQETGFDAPNTNAQQTEMSGRLAAPTNSTTVAVSSIKKDKAPLPRARGILSDAQAE